MTDLENYKKAATIVGADFDKILYESELRIILCMKHTHEPILDVTTYLEQNEKIYKILKRKLK